MSHISVPQDGKALVLGPASSCRPPRGRAAHMLVRFGNWYWRRRLPACIHDTSQPNFLSRCRDVRLALGTSDRGEARRRAFLLDAEFERLIMNAHRGVAPAAGTLTDLLADQPQRPASPHPNGLQQRPATWLIEASACRQISLYSSIHIQH